MLNVVFYQLNTTKKKYHTKFFKFLSSTADLNLDLFIKMINYISKKAIELKSLEWIVDVEKLALFVLSSPKSTIQLVEMHFSRQLRLINSLNDTDKVQKLEASFKNLLRRFPELAAKYFEVVLELCYRKLTALFLLHCHIYFLVQIIVENMQYKECSYTLK